MEASQHHSPSQAPRQTGERVTDGTLKNVMLAMAGIFMAVLIFVAGLTVGASAGNGFRLTGAAFAATQPEAGNDQSNVNMTLVNDVIRRLRSQWYGEFPTNDQLTDGALRGLVSSLGDPYTAYVEPQYAKILEQDMTSKFEGIGATLRQTAGGAVQIVRTYENSPANKGGVLPGDIVEAVNGTKVTDLSTYEVAALVRGRKGTKVTLTLRRADQPKPFDLTLTREEIVIPLVTSKLVGDGKIGYVSLFDFSQQASTQLNSKLQELLKQNPKGIILDLRDNPGGLLSQAVEVGDTFLKEGVFIIERDNKGNEKRDYVTDKGIAQDIPLVVLVNSGSASAAEIVAGAIQDYGRGKLIGETTFGKGSVQLPQTLSNGGQLRITIQRWYTPKDRGIHGKGVTPDFVVTRSVEEQQANQDPQLDAAVDYLLSGKSPVPTPIPTVPATAAP